MGQARGVPDFRQFCGTSCQLAVGALPKIWDAPGQARGRFVRFYLLWREAERDDNYQPIR